MNFKTTSTSETTISVFIALAATFALAASPAFSASEAGLYASSDSGGISAAGGESQSGGVLGQPVHNESMEKGLNVGSHSGMCTSHSDTSVFEGNIMVDGYHRLYGYNPVGARNSVAAQRHSYEQAKEAAPSRVPQMVVTTYDWGKTKAPAKNRHTLAGKQEHGM